MKPNNMMIKLLCLDIFYYIATYFSIVIHSKFHVNIENSTWYDHNYKCFYNNNKWGLLKDKIYLASKYYSTYKDRNFKFLLRNNNMIEKCYYATMKSVYNDPELYRQWYFIRHENESTYLSHELDKVWAQGITGKGVKVGIIGGRVDYFHKDLKDNFDSFVNFYLLKNSKNFLQNYNNISTLIAGLISSVPNNFLCGVGAAPESKFVSIQIFHSDTEIIDDRIIEKAITHRIDEIAIYIFAWTFYIDTNIKKFPGKLSSGSIKTGGESGRFGLGSIYIMGAGNYRMRGNNCAFNGFIQMKEILVFGSISYKGSPLLTIERCSSVIASSIGTESDLSNEKLYSTSIDNTCSYSAHGSITAASISAGIIALLISVNPFLTVRQIIFLIVLSSIQYDKYAICNSGGFFYSYAFGFGMLNIEGLIELSMLNDINYIAEEHICITPLITHTHRIKKRSTENIYIYTSGCLESNICVTEIEHAFLTFTILSYARNTIRVLITSPSGTNMSVIEPREFDNVRYNFKRWKVKIMGFFGENPLGVWTLQIFTFKQVANLVKFSLEFHGSCLNSHLSLTSHHNIMKYICFSKQYSNYKTFEHICDGFRHRSFLKNTFDYLSFTNFEFPINSTLNSFR